MRNFHTLTVCLWKSLYKDAHNTVLCDPGRRDLLYCMHEDSTSYTPRTYRYTADQRRKELKVKKRRDAKATLKRKHPAIQKAMDAISATRCRTASLTDFREYLRIRGLHTPLLRDFYAQSHFRQWKWKTYQYDQQSNNRLVSKIREHFGPDPLLVIGDHSSPNTRFHAPVRGLGMKRMLQHKGIRVVHIDEYRMSQVCPCCNGKTETFRLRRNPRPWHSYTKKVHGLKRCTHQTDASHPFTRYWNHDLMATINFRRILQIYRDGRGRPGAFKRASLAFTSRYF